MMLKRSFDYATTALLILSVSLNLGLAWKLHALTEKLKPPVTNVGTLIPEMDAKDLLGHPTRIRFASSGEPTVLYVFSPTCHWCAKNLSNLKKLYDHEHGRFNFVGVSLGPDDVPQYIAKSGFPLHSVRDPSPEAVRTLHLAGTPETIVIDSSGTVREVWDGAYRADMCRKIENYFGMPTDSLSGI